MVRCKISCATWWHWWRPTKTWFQPLTSRWHYCAQVVPHATRRQECEHAPLIRSALCLVFLHMSPYFLLSPILWRLSATPCKDRSWHLRGGEVKWLAVMPHLIIVIVEWVWQGCKLCTNFESTFHQFLLPSNFEANLPPPTSHFLPRIPHL